MPQLMTSGVFRITFLLMFLSCAICARAGEMPAAEKTKIEALLTHVGGLGDAKFVRNGKDYDAKSAAKFLRGKWEANAKQIHNAADFITVAATRSSTTGQPYMIRLKDAPPVPCGDYLTARLKQMGK